MDELQEHIPIELEKVPKRSKTGTLLVITSVIIVLCLAVYISTPPSNFPTKTFLKIREGETLGEITDRAAFLHLVRSSTLLKFAVKIFGNDRKLQTGDYYFDRPVTFWTVAHYLATGDFNINPEKVILFEGISRREMAPRLAGHLPYFDSQEFMDKTKDDEGFLFPDTYFISPAADTDEVIALLRNAYERTVTPLRDDISKSNMTEREVITLASLMEKEASGDGDRATIAGILLNRLNKGMRLQVDAPFLYYLEKPTVDAADLKVDSPYNTYTRSGLPAGPIGSPGYKSIYAVLHPVKTSYLFYLHSKDGTVHYAKTFTEHKSNISKYLIH